MNTVPLDSPVGKIRKYAKEGFLFHGSFDGSISILEPRPAKHSNPSDTFHNDTAVFASDAPESTVLFAVIPPKSHMPEELRVGKFSVRWSADGGISAKIPLLWKSFLETASGYVYVLPSDTFLEKTGGSKNNIYKSKTPVKPVDIIRVSLSDYTELGGKIEWN